MDVLSRVASDRLFERGHFGRRAERQGKAEPRSAAGIVLDPDFSAVRFDNGTADCEPEADAGCRRFARAAGELVEDRFALGGGHARTVITDADQQLIVGHVGGDPDAAAGRCVFAGVLEQIVEHSLDKDRVELHQRQIGRQRDLDTLVGECGLDRLERAADDFLDRLPFTAKLHVAAFDACHVEQIVDQCIHPAGFAGDGLGGVALHARKRGPGQLERLCEAHQRGEGRAQIVGQGSEQGIAQTLGLHADERGLRHLHVVHALERNRDQRRERVQVASLLGHQQLPPIRCLDREHAACSHGCAQRQVQKFAAGQRIGARTGRLRLVVGPLRCRDDIGPERAAALIVDLELVAVVGYQDRDLGGERCRNELARRLDDLVGLQQARHVAREFVERRSALLARPDATRAW